MFTPTTLHGIRELSVSLQECQQHNPVQLPVQSLGPCGPNYMEEMYSSHTIRLKTTFDAVVKEHQRPGVDTKVVMKLSISDLRLIASILEPELHISEEMRQVVRSGVEVVAPQVEFRTISEPPEPTPPRLSPIPEPSDPVLSDPSGGDDETAELNIQRPVPIKASTPVGSESVLRSSPVMFSPISADDLVESIDKQVKADFQMHKQGRDKRKLPRFVSPAPTGSELLSSNTTTADSKRVARRVRVASMKRVGVPQAQFDSSRVIGIYIGTADNGYSELERDAARVDDGSLHVPSTCKVCDLVSRKLTINGRDAPGFQYGHYVVTNAQKRMLLALHIYALSGRTIAFDEYVTEIGLLTSAASPNLDVVKRWAKIGRDEEWDSYYDANSAESW